MKKPTKKRGRPAKGGRSYSIKLTDEVADQLRQFGGEKLELTLGIERLAAYSMTLDAATKKKLALG